MPEYNEIGLWCLQKNVIYTKDWIHGYSGLVDWAIKVKTKSYKCSI